MKPDLKAAQGFYADLNKALNRIPPYSYKDAAVTAARDAAQDAVKALIEGAGGKVSKPLGGVAVSLFGLRASSTSGLEQACRNWMAQLTLKSTAARMEAAQGGAA